MKDRSDANTRSWFFFTMLYLVVDYVRPQDLVPALGLIKPGMVVSLILCFYIVSHGSIIFRADSKQSRLILIFVLLLGIFIPFAVNNYFAYVAAQTMLLYLPFVFSLTICIDSIDRLKTLLFICITIMIYIALYGIGHGIKGSGNYFHDENDLSLFINMWLPFCYCLFFEEKAWTKRIIYLFGLLVGTGTVIASFSRGGFVGLVIMAAVLWFYSHKKFVTLVVVGVSAGLIFMLAGDAYWNRISTIEDTSSGTAGERILSWETGWDMFLANPLGVGGNNFQVRFPEYQGNRFSKGMWGRVAHSLWFTLIPETGILGIIIYSMLLYYNVKDIFVLKSFNRDSDLSEGRFLYALSIAFISSLAGFFASATFLSVLYYPHYWYMTAIIVASSHICGNGVSREMHVSKST